MEMDREGNSILFDFISKCSDIRRRTLEIGCGDGVLASEIGRKFELNMECVDPYAYLSGDGVEIFKIPAEEINSLDKRYDIIYTIRAFHHIDRVDEFIKGLKDVIAYNGVFILVDWKNGFDTGVPERYYNLDDVRILFEKEKCKIIESGEGKSVFYIVVKYEFKDVCFPLKNGKVKSLNEEGVILQSVDLDSFEIGNIENEKEISILFSCEFGEKEQLLNKKGIKTYLSSGDIKRDIEFLKSIGKLNRCIWQPSCPVYLRYKNGELPSFWVDNYCFIGNKDCIRYQMEERGEYHSDYMLPNGEIKK